MPAELRVCLQCGGDTTLMVWADLDDDMADGEALKREFWREAQNAGASRGEFDTVVFVFARDRLENWVEFLLKGATNEEMEGPRVENNEAAAAADKLAEMCGKGAQIELPPSLEWSCKNWQALVKRMRKSSS